MCANSFLPLLQNMAGSAVLILVVLLLVVGVGAAFLLMNSGSSSSTTQLSISKLTDTPFYLCQPDGTCDETYKRKFTFQEHATKEGWMWRFEAPGNKKHLYILKKLSSTTEALKFSEFINNTGEGTPDNSWVVKLDKKGRIVMTSPSGEQLVQGE